jgi:hypothetical protein
MYYCRVVYVGVGKKKMKKEERRLHAVSDWDGRREGYMLCLVGLGEEKVICCV